MTWFHRHRYTPVEVQHARYTGAEGGQVTVILKRCRCGQHDTETIPGLWSAGRFLPAKEI